MSERPERPERTGSQENRDTSTTTTAWWVLGIGAICFIGGLLTEFIAGPTEVHAIAGGYTAISWAGIAAGVGGLLFIVARHHEELTAAIAELKVELADLKNGQSELKQGQADEIGTIAERLGDQLSHKRGTRNGG